MTRRPPCRLETPSREWNSIAVWTRSVGSGRVPGAGATSTWRTRRRPCTTPSSPSRAATSQSTRPSPPRREPSVDCAVVEARPSHTRPATARSFDGLVANLNARHAEALLGAGRVYRRRRRRHRRRRGRGQRGDLQAHDRPQPRRADHQCRSESRRTSRPCPPAPGVWRLTPPFAAPQTPWVGNVRRFVLAGASTSSSPHPPPSLQSAEWVESFNQIKAYGPLNGSARSDEQTKIARFWSAKNARSASTTDSDATSRPAVASSRRLGWQQR